MCYLFQWGRKLKVIKSIYSSWFMYVWWRNLYFLHRKKYAHSLRSFLVFEFCFWNFFKKYAVKLKLVSGCYKKFILCEDSYFANQICRARVSINRQKVLHDYTFLCKTGKSFRRNFSRVLPDWCVIWFFKQEIYLTWKIILMAFTGILIPVYHLPEIFTNFSHPESKI